MSKMKWYIPWTSAGIAAVLAIFATAWTVTRHPVASTDGGASTSAGGTSVHVPSGLRTQVKAATRQVDLLQAVDGRDHWELSAEVHLPGVESSHLAGNLDEWIGSLPPERRHAARAFAERYAPAYAVTDKAVQAWMLEQGFPSLEEFAAFDFDRDTAKCDRLTCTNPTIASLAADHFAQEMEGIVPSSVLAARGDIDLGSLLTDEERQSMASAYVNAKIYVDRVRESGNVIFAAYLDGRIEMSMGNSTRAKATQLFIAACGDKRVQVDAVQELLVNSVLTMTVGSACNPDVGRPAFPESNHSLVANGN